MPRANLDDLGPAPVTVTLQAGFPGIEHFRGNPETSEGKGQERGRDQLSRRNGPISGRGECLPFL